MILFYPQWQGAGPDNRIDKPARELMDALGSVVAQIGSSGVIAHSTR